MYPNRREKARFRSCVDQSWFNPRSPALVADGNHARVDGFVSLGVIVSAVVVALGLPRADPIVGLLISLVILKITWDSWQTIHGRRDL